MFEVAAVENEHSRNSHLHHEMRIRIKAGEVQGTGAWRAGTQRMRCLASRKGPTVPGGVRAAAGWQPGQ